MLTGTTIEGGSVSRERIQINDIIVGIVFLSIGFIWTLLGVSELRRPTQWDEGRSWRFKIEATTGRIWALVGIVLGPTLIVLGIRELAFGL